MIGLGVLTLAATGWAYKYFSHPRWNTHLLSLVYIFSGCTIGTSTLYWIGLSFPSVPAADSFGYVPPIVGGLLILHFLYGFNYVHHVHPALKLNLREKTGRIAFLCLLFAFVLPLIFIASFLFSPGGSVFTSSLILASMAMGIYYERILFFSIESPNYMLHIFQKKIP